MGLVPDSASGVTIVDMDGVLKDERLLESELPDSLIIRRFDDLEQDLERSVGIILEDIDTFVDVHDGIEIFAGLDVGIDFDLVEDTLDGNGFAEDDYRGYTLWERSRDSVAILKEDDYVVSGTPDSVRRILRVMNQGDGFLLQDDEDPLKRVLDRLGTGLVVRGGRDCGDNRYDLRRCEAAAFSVSTDSESYLLKHTLVFLFGSERTAERHIEDFESHLEKVQDSVSSLEYEVIHDGEFIEVNASIDWDDLGDCYLLETLIGDKCLIRASVPPPAPRSTPGLAVREPTVDVEKEVVKEVPVLREVTIGDDGNIIIVEKESPFVVPNEGPAGLAHLAYEPVMQMRNNLGKVMRVKGSVVHYMALPAQQSPFALEIQDRQNPSVTNWLLVQGNRHLAPRYLGETVCVTGAVQKAIGLLIEFGILEGYAIEVSSSSQLMRC